MSEAASVDPTYTGDRESLSDREVAERFIELFHRQDRLRDGFLAWVHPDYIQHNPNAPSGRDETLEVLDQILTRFPQMHHEVKRVIHGPGHVVVHYHWTPEPGDRGAAVVDILRIEKGWIVEHWDVIQPVPDPADCKNANGMF